MINLTNFDTHPTRKAYSIFRFYDFNRQAYFEQLLLQDNIWFEKETYNEDETIWYVFGVRNSDLKKVKHINYLVAAKYRKPIIPNIYFRWILLLVSFGLIALAIIGYFMSNK